MKHWILNLIGLTLCAQSMHSTENVSLKNQQQPSARPVQAEDVVWKRDVYRMVDLSKMANAALYVPVDPSAEQKNLFSTLFEAIALNKLNAYEYLDGREVFTPTYAVQFKDLLKRFNIPYREKSDPKKPGIPIFDIDAIDIPTSEVTLYYVKETYFLDQRTSGIQTHVSALCPVLIRTDEMGELRRHPMFWLPLDQAKPFLSQQAVAADTLNSAQTISLYDFFRQRRYEGDIYKVSNVRNQTIWDYCTTPEAIESEQKRLENMLQSLDEALWEPNVRDEKIKEDEK